ncbi:MAG: hypothetical protein WAW41_16100, partial [Methylobacter sp.]
MHCSTSCITYICVVAAIAPFNLAAFPPSVEVNADSAGANIRPCRCTDSIIPCRNDGDIPMISIGTSGWSYPHWQDCFYTGVARKDWLKFYAERFSA